MTPSEGEAMLKTVTIILPSGYASAEEFAKDCGFELSRAAAQPGMREHGGQAIHALTELFKAYDSGNLQMSSPEIGEPENNIPLHPWHEEWIYNARAALAQQEDSVTRPERRPFNSSLPEGDPDRYEPPVTSQERKPHE